LLQVSEKVFQPAGLHVAQSADEGEKAANRKRGNNPASIAPINSQLPGPSAPELPSMTGDTMTAGDVICL
jgi:hypothetical protein